MPETMLNNLILELVFGLPLSGEVHNMCHCYSNELLLECLQYTLEELDCMGESFFEYVICSKNHFALANLISRLSVNEQGNIQDKAFRLICKDKQTLWVLWKCRVIEWHYPGKPRKIVCCGFIINEKVFEDEDLQSLRKHYLSRALLKKVEKLTDRETEVAIMVKKKFNNSQIVNKLHITPETLKTHKQHIAQKLGLSSARDLDVFFAETGLFD